MIIKNRWFACQFLLAKKSDPTWWCLSKEGKQHTLFGLNKVVFQDYSDVPVYSLVLFRLNVSIVFTRYSR